MFFIFPFQLHNEHFKRTGKTHIKSKSTYNPVSKRYSFQSFYTFASLFSERFISISRTIFVTKQNILRTFCHVFYSSSVYQWPVSSTLVTEPQVSGPLAQPWRLDKASNEEDSSLRACQVQIWHRCHGKCGVKLHSQGVLGSSYPIFTTLMWFYQTQKFAVFKVPLHCHFSSSFRKLISLSDFSANRRPQAMYLQQGLENSRAISRQEGGAGQLKYPRA